MTAMSISFREISTELQINRATVYRWRQLPQFASELSRLVNTAREECKERVIRDISEIKDIVMNTLLDVAQYDTSGSARVSAARALTEMIQKAEDRSDWSDVMRDQSEEIKGLLHISRSLNKYQVPLLVHLVKNHFLIIVFPTICMGAMVHDHDMCSNLRFQKA
jgi:hypothetical protein